MRILFNINCSFSAWHFRKGLMKRLLDDGHDVVLIAPRDDRYDQKLEGIGVRRRYVSVDRYVNVWSDIKLAYAYCRIIRSENPDLVHNITIKPNIYGTISARLAGVKRIVCSTTGLGYIYEKSVGFRMYIFRQLVSMLYRISFLFSEKVSFQNTNDLEEFVDGRIIGKSKGVLIKSSGVDLSEFSKSMTEAEDVRDLRKKYDVSSTTKVVAMIARANRSKGVFEFIEASRMLESACSDYIFVFIGSVEGGSGAITPDELIAKHSPHFKWIGFQHDIRLHIAMADLMVLPSYYREGVPRSLLEAMAMGKPIVTTDNVGCREVVEDGVNGYIVPTRDSKALAAAIEKIMVEPGMLDRFGNCSREKVEREFDEQRVVEETFSMLYCFDVC